jgi:antirestriction protein ArdC
MEATMATNDRPQPQSFKRDFRQEATDAIIRMLEEGVAPWQKPWQSGAIATPFNPTTEKPYRGGNAVYLIAVAAKRGYDDPRWMSYKQAQQRGWQVRRGETGTQIEYWEFPSASREREQRGGHPDSEQGDKIAPRMIHRIYTVFNAKQIDGIPPYTPKQRQEFEIVRAAESILEHSGARILHDQNDRAFYNRAADSIHLPPKAAFSSAPDYYGTALHELAHWTGHPSRLNRQTLNESYRFGDLNYAHEELRAELTSLFLAAERGIPHNPASHAAYVGSWLQALRNDKNEIFRAAKDAHRATDFLLTLELERSVEKALEAAGAPHLRRETAEYVAAYEPGSSTVDLEQKRTATEHRAPAERDPAETVEPLAEAEKAAEQILDDQVQSLPEPSPLKKSFAAAQEMARRVLSPNARTFVADTASGVYRGEILGETELHVVQRLSAQSTVAHIKSVLERVPQIGESVAISYSHSRAVVNAFEPHERTHALAR